MHAVNRAMRALPAAAAPSESTGHAQPHDWLALLRAAVSADPRGMAGVAEGLGISRTAISLVLRDKYPADSRRIAQRVLDAYDRVRCPHLHALIPLRVCRAYALRGVPTTNAREMRHWRACQTCPQRPSGAVDPTALKFTRADRQPTTKEPVK